MEHSELVAEMAQVEHLATQDRLHLARMRRAHQLKVAKQKEKEWMKSQSRRDRNAILAGKKQRHITFENSVVVLEAAARNDIDEVGRLLELGVSPDATNEDGLTPLHQCCIDNNADMLRLLLDYGAAVNAKDSEKWTPLHAAATCGHLYLVKILISRGANLLAVNVDGNMPYDLCDDEETLDCIEAEMSRRGVTQELIDETRAATETQMLGDLTEVATRGGDLEVPDKHGATPLHIAAANGYSKVVEFLLEHQVAVDSVDKDLWTPVHAAACWGHMEVLEMLAMSGADLNACNKNEETPSDICEDAEIRERIEQLKTEQESKRQAEAQRRRVRRSQSNNTRAQSVRRTSLRDKTLTTKKDAVEETRLRLQAQEGYSVPDSTTEPNSIASDVPDSASVRPLTAGSHHHNATSSSTSSYHLPNGHHPNGGGSSSAPVSSATVAAAAASSTVGVAYAPQIFDAALSRRSPDGTDSTDAYGLHGAEELKPVAALPANNNTSSGGGNGINITTTTTTTTTSNNNNNNNNHHNHHSLNSSASSGASSSGGSSTNNGSGKMGNSDISAEIFSTSNDNGKINVQVTVLVDTHQLDQSLAGTTLANLKKQRAQSRTSTSSSTDNGSLTVGNIGGNSTSSNIPIMPTIGTASQPHHVNSNHHHHHHQQQQQQPQPHRSSNASSNASNSLISTTHNGNMLLLEPSKSSTLQLLQQQHNGPAALLPTTNGNNKPATAQLDVVTLTATTTASSLATTAAPAASVSLHDANAPKITKFSGVTSDVVSDSTSRRCCALM